VQFVDEFSRADGAAAAHALLDAGVAFDAIFAFNDLLALGAMHALLSRGVRVPDDVAVMGFDDIQESRYASPSLSTVAPDTDAIARTALDLLLPEAGQAAPEDAGGVERTIPFQIVKRAST
jgi:DNA-binding LacI/PurR family transcriptional regulator